MSKQKTQGSILRDARERAGLTLVKLGDAVGFSTTYICELEADKKPLAPEHWAKFVTALPHIDLYALATAVIDAGPIRVDPSTLNKTDRAGLAVMLADASRRMLL